MHLYPLYFILHIDIAIQLFEYVLMDGYGHRLMQIITERICSCFNVQCSCYAYSRPSRNLLIRKYNYIWISESISKSVDFSHFPFGSIRLERFSKRKQNHMVKLLLHMYRKLFLLPDRQSSYSFLFRLSIYLWTVIIESFVLNEKWSFEIEDFIDEKCCQ